MTNDYTAIKLTPLRKAIASRMASAVQTIPHYRLGVDIDVQALVDRRARLKTLAPDQRFSLNDCFVRAVALTLRLHPELNIQFVDDEIRRFDRIAISIVVAIENGLITPIIEDADRKVLTDIAAETRDLIGRARAGTLRMSEVAGGTFSISNLGSSRVDAFDAIINPPQCAILALARIRTGFVESSDGATAARQMLRATLSLDHRVIDGSVGGAFLGSLCALIEQPDAIFSDA